MSSIVTEFAHIDPVTLEVGLFKARPSRGEVQKLHVLREHGAYSYVYSAPGPLDHVGLGILLTLCALAAMTPRVEVSACPATPPLWKKFSLQQDEGTYSSVALWQGSLSDIVREAGMSNAGSNTALVRRRLEALSAVRVEKYRTRDGALLQASNLIGVLERKNSNEVRVALCPHLSASVVRSLGQQYVHICLKTFRSIERPAGRILHAVLCNRIRPTAQRPARYSLQKLSEIPYVEAKSLGAERKRKSTTAAIVRDLVTAGWAFETEGKTSQVFEIWHHANERRAVKPGHGSHVLGMTGAANMLMPRTAALV